MNPRKEHIFRWKAAIALTYREMMQPKYITCGVYRSNKSSKGAKLSLGKLLHTYKDFTTPNGTEH